MNNIQDVPAWSTILLCSAFIIGIVASLVYYPAYIGIKRRNGLSFFGVAFFLAAGHAS